MATRAKKDITGEKFGHLTAVRFAGRMQSSGGNLKTVWLWRCDCGKEVEKLRENVTSGGTSSCGCMKSQLLACKHDLETIISKNREFVPPSMAALSGRVVKERHVQGHSFGYAPSSLYSSLEYI